ncbi:hypothetical protein F1654_03285 [Alkalicaulis satelles]|uniref:Uncharacterized protein n=1 Tax=Alkalicaulis satelles TaxID=2609175 RepID=A0A5M6ZJP8_9PROT|nr:hypothetical protein [Alkalicaulis satelles]KAA5805033.1 hypothetical protein F1654_03285 [Alkalicaulis satelles]
MIALKSLLAATLAAILLQEPYGLRISGDLILKGLIGNDVTAPIAGARFAEGEFGAPPASARAGVAVLYLAEGADLAALQRALQSRDFSGATLNLRTPDGARRYELTGVTLEGLIDGGGPARDATARLNLRYQQVRSE